MGAIRLRPLDPADASAARSLVTAEMGATPHGEAGASALAQALESAATGVGTESRGIIAERNGEIVGLVLYGLVPGSSGAGKLHGVVVTASARLHGVGSQLCDAAATALLGQHARFIIVEIADDPRTAPGRALLARAGFREEARVPDFVGDGIALVFLRRDLAG